MPNSNRRYYRRLLGAVPWMCSPTDGHRPARGRGDVIMPTDEVAVIAYKVHQTGDMKSKPMDMKCADSTTWVRDGQSWKCALHTETMLQSA